MNRFMYFKSIVESDFNLTKASKKLYISQPALSKFISNLEKDYGIELFVRYNGRLIGLTKMGEFFYRKSIEMLKIYEEINIRLETASKYYSGEIIIGIPPLIISVLFTEFLNNIVQFNPNLKITIIEYGAHRLIEEIENGKLDVAIVLQPNSINNKLFQETLIHEDELTAFINHENTLYGQKRVTWQDLADQPLAIFNQEYMIHHQLVKKFNDLSLTPKIRLEIRSWDFMVSAVRQNDLVTILPQPTIEHVNAHNVKMIPIEDPIPWKVSMVYPKKSHYTMVEKYIIQSVKDYFLEHRPVISMEEMLALHY